MHNKLTFYACLLSGIEVISDKQDTYKPCKN